MFRLDLEKQHTLTKVIDSLLNLFPQCDSDRKWLFKMTFAHCSMDIVRSSRKQVLALTHWPDCSVSRLPSQGPRPLKCREDVDVKTWSLDPSTNTKDVQASVSARSHPVSLPRGGRSLGCFPVLLCPSPVGIYRDPAHICQSPEWES